MNLNLRLALLVINIGAIYVFQIKKLLYFAVSSHLFLFALDVFTQMCEKRLNNSKKPLLALSIIFFRIDIYFIYETVYTNNKHRLNVISVTNLNL